MLDLPPPRQDDRVAKTKTSARPRRHRHKIPHAPQHVANEEIKIVEPNPQRLAKVCHMPNRSHRSHHSPLADTYRTPEDLFGVWSAFVMHR